MPEKRGRDARQPLLRSVKRRVVAKRHAADGYGYRDLLRLAVPLAATTACFAATLFTDRTFLMWFSPTASAACMAAGNLYWALTCMPVAALGFLTPLVAQTLGGSPQAEQKRRAWRLVCQSVWITLAVVPLLALVAVASPWLFHLAGHEPNLAAAESKYLAVLLLVAPAAMLEAGLTAFFLGQRRTRSILVANLVAAGVNVVLDYWWIFGGFGVPALGVVGAALATAAAMWLKVLFFAGMLLRERLRHEELAHAWRPSATLVRQILYPGSALGVQQFVRSLMFAFVLLRIGAQSVTALAATSAALAIYQLLSIPAIGLTTAATVVAGQASTTRNRKLARDTSRRCLVTSSVIATLLAAVVAAMPLTLLDVLFRELEPGERVALVPLALGYMKFVSVYFLLDITAMMLAALSKGLGKTSDILSATLLSCLLLAPVGWLTEPGGDSAGAHWWTLLLVWSAFQGAVLTCLLFYRMRQTPALPSESAESQRAS